MKQLAQIKLFDQDYLKGFGPLGLESKGPSDAPSLFNTFLTSVIGIITVVGFIWFVFLIITGAISIMTAGGDKNAVAGAAKKITNGLIGLVVLIAALFIIDLFGTLMGIPDILNPASVIQRIGIQ